MIERDRLEELQFDASGIGYLLSRLSLYNIDQIFHDLKEKLYHIGKELHLVETMRIYMDGGRLLRAVQERISDLNAQLTDLAEQLP
jgi:hypothetical protein